MLARLVSVASVRQWMLAVAHVGQGHAGRMCCLGLGLIISLAMVYINPFMFISGASLCGMHT